MNGTTSRKHSDAARDSRFAGARLRSEAYVEQVTTLNTGALPTTTGIILTGSSINVVAAGSVAWTTGVLPRWPSASG
jgi:hypothetical protein